jgi:peptidoglycan/xylan/chitin deacetylase (PgdA/CDA1 family)
VERESDRALQTEAAAQQLAVCDLNLTSDVSLTLADCGTNSSYCYSPNCQYKYGPGCPEHQKPDGESTESIPRAKIGSVPYGGNGIYGGFTACKDPGHVAITFDDGPHKDFTATILDLFKKYDAKATFFITGNNIAKGRIDKTQEYIDVIKRMDAEGHQIASHTWTHLDLSKIDADDRKDQILNVEGALNNIVGKIPTYIRPPYSSCTVESGCEQFMQDMGYHIIYFKIDTDDYQQAPKNTFQTSLDWFKGNMTAPGMTPEKNSSISISHDIIDQTANELTEFMLKTITELGYKGVTIGECLGDAKDNWYRKFGDSADRVGANSTSTSVSSSSVSSSSQVRSSVTCTVHCTDC